jgi:hypothetical protein
MTENDSKIIKDCFTYPLIIIILFIILGKLSFWIIDTFF